MPIPIFCMKAFLKAMLYSVTTCLAVIIAGGFKSDIIMMLGGMAGLVLCAQSIIVICLVRDRDRPNQREDS